MREIPASYLHAQAGCFHLLLNGAAVHDAIEHGAESRLEPGAILPWRGGFGVPA